jgi:hypothetical protein
MLQEKDQVLAKRIKWCWMLVPEQGPRLVLFQEQFLIGSVTRMEKI